MSDGNVTACSCVSAGLEKTKQNWLYKNSYLPIGYENKTFSTFTVKNNRQGNALKVCQQYADGSEIKVLSLIGGVDTGKTHLAIAVCHKFIERGLRVRFAFVPDLMIELRRAIMGEESDYPYYMQYLCTVDLLVLDDLGLGKQTEFVREQLQTIINSRANTGKNLIVTCNRPLVAMLGDTADARLANARIASRLQREAWCKVIILGETENRTSNV